MIESLVQDCRYGARVLRKSPGFTFASVLILGLGIGANSAIFSVVNAVVLRPLPFANADRIMRVWHKPPREQFSGSTIFAVSPANYLDWRAQNHVFERIAIYGYRQVNLTGQGEPDALTAMAVSPDFFAVLGIPATAGRVLGPGDDEPGRANVVVLNETAWKSRFGGDPSIVGRSVALNGEQHTVVGVVPERLAFPQVAQVWVPLVWTPEERAALTGRPVLSHG